MFINSISATTYHSFVLLSNYKKLKPVLCFRLFILFILVPTNPIPTNPKQAKALKSKRKTIYPTLCKSNGFCTLENGQETKNIEAK